LELMLPEAGKLGACRLQRAKYKPRRKLTAYYDLAVHPYDDTGNYTRPIAVTWSLLDHAPTPQQDDSGPADADPRQRGIAAPFGQLAATVPAWDMKIEVSPLDPRYPQLARLSDPCYVRNLLAKYTLLARARELSHQPAPSP
jgi:hypothetical protein